MPPLCWPLHRSHGAPTLARDRSGGTTRQLGGDLTLERSCARPPLDPVEKGRRSEAGAPSFRCSRGIRKMWAGATRVAADDYASWMSLSAARVLVHWRPSWPAVGEAGLPRGSPGGPCSVTPQRGSPPTLEIPPWVFCSTGRNLHEEVSSCYVRNSKEAWPQLRSRLKSQGCWREDARRVSGSIYSTCCQALTRSRLADRVIYWTPTS